MKLTRRDFASVLAPATALAATPAAALSATPATALSATPATAQQAAPAPPTADALLEAARARAKANGAILAGYDIPMDTEPAFQFKA